MNLFSSSPDGWSREGCHALKTKNNAEETECRCNHLTHFAVLFDYSDANSGVTCTTKITPEWARIFVHQPFYNNTKECGRVNKKRGNGPCTKFEPIPKFGNFVVISSWVLRWSPLQEVVVVEATWIWCLCNCFYTFNWYPCILPSVEKRSKSRVPQNITHLLPRYFACSNTDFPPILKLQAIWANPTLA